MVNGTFLLPFNWEKVAGQTWSTRPYCRPIGTPAKHLSHFKISVLQLGTAFALLKGEPRLGRALAVRKGSANGLGGLALRIVEGEN
jgi:hypothetical protein